MFYIFQPARENRICPLCNNGEIGDEFHYLFKCQYFGNQRKNYIKKNFRINPNIIKFKLLMTSTSKIELQKLCRLILYPKNSIGKIDKILIIRKSKIFLKNILK
jgi:hypothetical protein